MPRKIPPDLQCKCPTCGADSNMFICQTCNELKPWHNGGTDGLECDECWKGDTMEHLAKLTERIPAKDALDIEIVVKRIVANAVSAALSPVNAELYKTQAALTDVRKQLKSEAQLGIDMAKDRDSWRADRDRILERYQTADKALHLICDITRVTALDKNYSLVVSSVKQLYDNLDASLQQALDLNKELDTAKAELKRNAASRSMTAHELSEAKVTIAEREKLIDRLRAESDSSSVTLDAICRELNCAQGVILDHVKRLKKIIRAFDQIRTLVNQAQERP